MTRPNSIPLCSSDGTFQRRCSLQELTRLSEQDRVVLIRNKRGKVTVAYLRQSDGAHPLRSSLSTTFTCQERISGNKIVSHKPLPNLPKAELMKLFYGPVLDCITDAR